MMWMCLLAATFALGVAAGLAAGLWRLRRRPGRPVPELVMPDGWTVISPEQGAAFNRSLTRATDALETARDEIKDLETALRVERALVESLIAGGNDG